MVTSLSWVYSWNQVDEDGGQDDEVEGPMCYERRPTDQRQKVMFWWLFRTLDHKRWLFGTPDHWSLVIHSVITVSLVLNWGPIITRCSPFTSSFGPILTLLIVSQLGLDNSLSIFFTIMHLFVYSSSSPEWRSNGYKAFQKTALMKPAIWIQSFTEWLTQP